MLSSVLTGGDDGEDPKALVRAIAGEKSSTRVAGMIAEELIDIGMSAIQFVREGSAEIGWVVRMIVNLNHFRDDVAALRGAARQWPCASAM